MRTPFLERDGLSWLELEFPYSTTEETRHQGINFVLYQPDTARWLKNDGRDMYLPLLPDTGTDDRLGAESMWQRAEQIIQAETGRGSWMLMHRFHLCHDLTENHTLLLNPPANFLYVHQYSSSLHYLFLPIS